jgi:hypothetical protein
VLHMGLVPGGRGGGEGSTGHDGLASTHYSLRGTTTLGSVGGSCSTCVGPYFSAVPVKGHQTPREMATTIGISSAFSEKLLPSFVHKYIYDASNLFF